jgi:uncharacterized membrane protein
MATGSRSEAQRRVDQIHAFRDELERLEREHVLTLGDEPRRALAEHHAALLAELAREFDVDRDVHAKQLSLGMRVASFLGALALAASVFFLFYQFWGFFPTAAQVAILISAALASFGLTMWLQRRGDAAYFAKLAALVAFACFVLDIAMLGGIFNVTPSDQALLAWAAFALLLAYTCELRLLLVAAILCIVAYVGARAGTFGGMYWLYFGARPENFFPAAVLLFAVPLVVRHRRLPEFSGIYRMFGMLALFLPMLVLANWGRVSYLDLQPGTIEGIYQVLGFAGCAALIWLGARRQWPEVVNTGTVFFVIFLYTKFFDWWWEVMPKYLFFFVLGLTAVLFLFVLRRLRAASQRPPGGAAP